MTESEEMYLVTLVRLCEEGNKSPISISLLAEELNILSVSVNQMVRKLEDQGLAGYTPYKGVALTEAGWSKASQVLRLRRLWEVFLVEKLNYTTSEADELACRLEHVLPEEAGERLAAFLSHPTTSPTGRPIPSGKPDGPDPASAPLLSYQPGSCIQITAIGSDRSVRAFLLGEGLTQGEIIRVQAVGSSRAMLVVTEKGHTIHISPELAAQILGKEIAIEP